MSTPIAIDGVVDVLVADATKDDTAGAATGDTAGDDTVIVHHEDADLPALFFPTLESVSVHHVGFVCTQEQERPTPASTAGSLTDHQRGSPFYDSPSPPASFCSPEEVLAWLAVELSG